MSQGVLNPTGQSSQTGTSGVNGSDEAIAQMEAAFDRAIAIAANVTARRMEGGSALDAARTRLSN